MTVICCVENGDVFDVCCDTCFKLLGVATFQEIATLSRNGYRVVCFDCEQRHNPTGVYDGHAHLTPIGNSVIGLEITGL